MKSLTELVRVNLLVCTVALATVGCQKKGGDTVELAANAASDGSEAGSAREAVPVKVVTVVPREYREYGEYYGNVHGISEAQLIAHGGGQVDLISAKPGDEVKRGQKLCDIDGKRFDIAYESTKLAEQIAQQNFNRLKQHLERGSSSQLSTDNARLALLQAKNAAVQAERNREGAFCIAPFDGVVTARHVDQFQNLMPGVPTLTLADLSSVKVRVGVPESAINGYVVGAEAQVALQGVLEKPRTGKVTSVAQSIDSSNRTFVIEIELENKDRALKPGLTAKTRILRYAFNDQIVVPTEVIVTKASSRIVMVDEGGVAKVREIIVKANNESESLIESGLNAGDRLVVKGQAVAVEGAPLKVVE